VLPHIKKTRRLLRATFSCAWFVSAAHAAVAVEVTELRDGLGRDLTSGRCIICHSVEHIPSSAPAMNRAAWQKTIQKMRDRFGAPITDEEANQILEYLAANHSGKSG
jgi:sulfite dehydrogenase (cytochrome) subunit B